MTSRWFSHIIVALDGSPLAERAIPVASALAAQVGVPVTVVRVVPVGDPGADAEEYLRTRQSEAAAVTDRAVLSGVPAAGTIIDFLEQHPRALLCCTTHARSALGELLLGSVAEELIRRSPVPLLLIGPHAAPAPTDGYRELVTCVQEDTVDPATSRLLPVVRDLCLGAHLRPWLFQVIDPSTSIPDDGTGGSSEAGPLPHLTESLAEGGLEAQQRVNRAGSVPEAISFFAGTLNGPIVALASRRRSLSERLRGGSVAVEVARIAPCPLLVIGPSCRSGEDLLRHVHTTR